MTESRYRWVIVAAGGLLGCVAIGAMFSLPVLLQPIARDTGWSVTGVSSAMTIGFLAMAFGSMAWGSLSDRFGPRAIVLTGSIILAVSLALASQATSLLAFQLDLRTSRGRERGGHHRADDGLRHRLVRHPSQPCRVARLGGHGHGAHDHGAPGRVARFNPELANHARDPRRDRRSPHDPGGASGAQAAGARQRQRRVGGRAAIRHVRRRGVALAAIRRARAHQLLLLRHPFRARSFIP